MTANKSKLPGLFITKDSLEEYIHIVMDKRYHGYYTVHPVRENEQQLQYEITCGTQEDSALLIAYYRSDGSLSLSYKSGKNRELGKIIVEAVYELAGRSHADISRPKAQRCTPELLESILMYLSDTRGLKIESRKDKPQTVVVFSDEEGKELTVQYWSTGKIFPQSKSPRLLVLFNDAYANNVRFSSVKDVDAEIKAMEFSESEMIKLDSFIRKELSEDLVAYLDKNNPAALSTLRTIYKRRLLDKTIKLEDYSSLIHEMCRVFESIIKTVFLSAGVPEKILAKEYFYPQKNPTTLDRSVLPQLEDKSTRKRLASIYKPYRAYRNPSAHGAANALKKHQVIRTYGDSEKRCKEVASAILTFFETVKPFFNQ